MSNDIDMRERHGRVLAELAEVGMTMVRRLSDAMLATDDSQTQAHIGLAFHRVSRAVRQTMALEFRLSQEARRDVAPARPAPAPESPPAPPPRVRAERTGWDEYERADSGESFDELDALLDAEAFDLDTAHEAVETCIANIRRDLDVDPMPATPVGLQPGSRFSSPIGGGGPAEGRWRGKPAAETSPGSPLDAALRRRSPPSPSARRSQLLGGAALAPPLLAVPRPAAPAWRSSA
jgi:hypothetical protein